MTIQYTSQTNQVFEIKSQSALISCLFDSPEVSKGGKASMSVLTQNVGDDSQIELELYNESAKKVGNIKGKVKDQRCTLIVPIDQPVGTKLKGIVKMSAHKLEQATSTILVVPALQVASVEWLNSQGEALAEISDEAIVEVVIKVADMPDGTTCQVSLQFQEQSGKKSIVISKKIRASEGKLSLVWIPAFPRPEHNHVHDDDVKPTGGKYEHPKVVAIITYKGSSFESKPIPYSSWMRYEFKGTKGKVTFRLPTGKEVTETIGDDGCIKLKGCGVGAIEIVEIVPNGNAPVEEDAEEVEATNGHTEIQSHENNAQEEIPSSTTRAESSLDKRVLIETYLHTLILQIVQNPDNPDSKLIGEYKRWEANLIPIGHNGSVSFEERARELANCGFSSSGGVALAKGRRQLSNPGFLKSLAKIRMQTGTDAMEYGFMGNDVSHEYEEIVGELYTDGGKRIDFDFRTSDSFGAHSHPKDTVLSINVGGQYGDLPSCDRKNKDFYVITKSGHIFMATPNLARVGLSMANGQGIASFGQVYLGSLNESGIVVGTIK